MGICELFLRSFLRRRALLGLKLLRRLEWLRKLLVGLSSIFGLFVRWRRRFLFFVFGIGRELGKMWRLLGC